MVDGPGQDNVFIPVHFEDNLLPEQIVKDPGQVVQIQPSYECLQAAPNTSLPLVVVLHVGTVAPLPKYFNVIYDKDIRNW